MMCKSSFSGIIGIGVPRAQGGADSSGPSGTQKERGPAQSRWWSMQQHMALLVLAQSVNSSFTFAFQKAFPTWDAGDT
eukprot:8967043-Karenia_brevis.AAC.1